MNSAIAFPSDLRAEQRFRLVSHELPGRLMIQPTSHELFAKPINVSSQGLGIAVAQKLNQGQILVLDLGHARIYLEVRWAKKQKKRETWRVGLRVINSDADLLREFFRDNIIEEDLEEVFM